MSNLWEIALVKKDFKILFVKLQTGNRISVRIFRKKLQFFKKGMMSSDERLATFRKIRVVLLPYSGFSFSRRDDVGNVERMCLSLCRCVGSQSAASRANYQPCHHGGHGIVQCAPTLTSIQDLFQTNS